MNIELLIAIISSATTLLSVGGLGWIVTAKEDKTSKKLDNKEKELNIEEKKKDEIIKDWKDIADERKSRCTELEITLKDRDEIIMKKDETISELRTKLDEKNTYCAVAELMRCEDVKCVNRKPPFGMRETKPSDSFKEN